MNRRAFLALLASAPVAALAPWRPPVVFGVDWGAGPSYFAIAVYRDNLPLFVEHFLSPPDLELVEAQREILEQLQGLCAIPHSYFAGGRRGGHTATQAAIARELVRRAGNPPVKFIPL